jgi:hypothetical protein
MTLLIGSLRISKSVSIQRRLNPWLSSSRHPVQSGLDGSKTLSKLGEPVGDGQLGERKAM